MLLNPAAFQACFFQWLQTLRAKAAEASGVDQPVFAVDGKTARRSHDRSNELGALHTVSVWASEFGLSLGQVACAEKSNEITAIPELLELVDIKGAIITIDAMGTQKAIAAQIIDRQADFVLALKGNQETLQQAVIDYIDQQSVNDFAEVPVRRLLTQEKGHGRQEVRSYGSSEKFCNTTSKEDASQQAGITRHGSQLVLSHFLQFGFCLCLVPLEFLMF
jgi:predicted transposase YbfD/YdcC